MDYKRKRKPGQAGLDFESAFVSALNGKRPSELNPNLERLVRTLFPAISPDSLLLAQKSDPRGKPDVTVFSEFGKAEISLKSCSGDLIHSSPNEKFTEYLQSWGISQSSIDTLLLFLYRDGTRDGSGPIKWSYEETMYRLSPRIRDLNLELNSSKAFVQDCLDLCLFRGNHPELPSARYFYHGDLENGILVSRYQISVWARKILDMDFILNPHVGPLHFRPYLQKTSSQGEKSDKLRWLRLKWVGMDANLNFISKKIKFEKKNLR